MVNTEIILIIFFAAKDGEALYNQKKKPKNKKQTATTTTKKPGADCGSDHECFIAKCRIKWKKVGKTTRPFRYVLKQSLMIIQWKCQIDSRD